MLSPDLLLSLISFFIFSSSFLSVFLAHMSFSSSLTCLCFPYLLAFSLSVPQLLIFLSVTHCSLVFLSSLLFSPLACLLLPLSPTIHFFLNHSLYPPPTSSLFNLPSAFLLLSFSHFYCFFLSYFLAHCCFVSVSQSLSLIHFLLLVFTLFSYLLLPSLSLSPFIAFFSLFLLVSLPPLLLLSIYLSFATLLLFSLLSCLSLFLTFCFSLSLFLRYCLLLSLFLLYCFSLSFTSPFFISFPLVFFSLFLLPCFSLSLFSLPPHFFSLSSVFLSLPPLLFLLSQPFLLSCFYSPNPSSSLTGLSLFFLYFFQ